jgi:hypothetical protein
MRSTVIAIEDWVAAGLMSDAQPTSCSFSADGRGS